MLSKNQNKFLRKLAQECKPVIWVGQHGLTENVYKEIDLALSHHELIKIKIRLGEREKRDEACADICAGSGAALVQKIGNTLSIYRANPENPVISPQVNKA